MISINTLPDSIAISLIGLMTVFISLCAILLMIEIFAKVFPHKEEPVNEVLKKVPVQSKPSTLQPANSEESELMAAIIAAVSEEAGDGHIVTAITKI